MPAGETLFARKEKTPHAVNPNTGNAAVTHKNSNGVTTTDASTGGEA
jgi:hypothetical protein